MAEKDTWNSNLEIDGLGTLYSGLYYYYLNGNSDGVVGSCPATVSCLFSPILDYSDLDCYTVSYDNDRFKDGGRDLGYGAYLFRIKGIKNPIKELKTLNKWRNITRTDYKSWRNESRLYQYPYEYGMLVDYINPPFEVPYHLVTGDKIKIMSKSMLSDKLAYSLYIENYKQDVQGQLEGSVNSGVLDVPCGSTAYAQYSATQKAQDMFNYQSTLQNLRFNQGRDSMNAKISMFSNLTGGLAGSVASGLSGSIGGALGGALQTGVRAYGESLNATLTQQEYAMKQQQAIGLKSAQIKDLQNTPRSMINTSSDVSYSLLNGKMSIDFYRMQITEEYKYRLGEYFYRYGYTRNEFIKPNIKSRKYFNFIQTVDCNIIGNSIPKTHLNEIKNIFDSGVTFWHYNNRKEMFNYNSENYEVDTEKY